MDPDLIYLLWICGVIGAIIMFFLVAIVLILTLDYYREKEYRRFEHRWERLLFNYLDGGIPVEKAALSTSLRKKHLWMWRFLLPYLESLRGEDYDKIVELSRLTGMQNYFLKKLRRGTIFKRALAARILGKLRCREALPMIAHLLKSRHPAVVVSASLSLADMTGGEYLIKTARALLRNTSITYEGATEILVGFGTENNETVINYLKMDLKKISSGDEDDKKTVEPEKAAITAIMVDILGYHRSTEALDTLHKMLDVTDEETVIHILKAFVRMKAVPEELDLKYYFKHPNWVIRSLAAKISRISGDEEYLPQLESLLDDPYWWARYRAAEALWDMGVKGRETLRQNAEGGDAPSATVSRYILAQER